MPPLYHIYPLDVRFAIETDYAEESVECLVTFTITIEDCTVYRKEDTVVNREVKKFRVYMDESRRKLVMSENGKDVEIAECYYDFYYQGPIHVSLRSKVAEEQADCVITWDDKRTRIYFPRVRDIDYRVDPYDPTTTQRPDTLIVNNFTYTITHMKCQTRVFTMVMILVIMLLVMAMFVLCMGIVLYRLRSDLEGEAFYKSVESRMSSTTVSVRTMTEYKTQEDDLEYKEEREKESKSEDPKNKEVSI
ncbi:unnamed protein product [Bursaphelenchus okinawaensis]|uniref:Uncharacterized protein n=1 Tax=Bursaphelenchus okinawaensis TaxID=465554 RepID=A0A811JSH5_9BILA|nr:unnamed protein product [Bursaphelenchus okinawaensis]CAG9080508.1 unnamed protein product [Bursaphelenchus okinawaensis]